MSAAQLALTQWLSSGPQETFAHPALPSILKHTRLSENVDLEDSLSSFLAHSLNLLSLSLVPSASHS